ncbi:MAG: cation transporter [Lactobacillus sp.]|jgi:copper chaperone CopZ|uniref:Heavy-metal-associated domain-containing protein n=1 Tax=Lacticaseibacillus suilingensis TaxID=2799577 RepID=A0ABW4BGI0_9LACO|nr:MULTISPECIES: cation transporter [Lacticaseibacillus]MCI1895057.1 cation transporter [Lactobacillus sp.]MCI1942399.1 cation transporter [Lactobacillus sp.]MCI1972953.1 cation transporter [Lactobacillus sp.]MCI2017927.1 cation transporter [Lactobacillus sp.]
MNKKISLQLDELTCPSCLTKIEGAVKQEPGVENVKVLFNAGKVKADFDDTQNSADNLANVVTKLGYEVKKVRVKDL